MIKKKNKTGVYSLKKNEFVLPPEKSYFYFVNRNKCLFVVNSKSGIVACNVYEGTESLIKIATDPKEIIFGYNREINHYVHKRQHFSFKRGNWEKIGHDILEYQYSPHFEGFVTNNECSAVVPACRRQVQAWVKQVVVRDVYLKERT